MARRHTEETQKDMTQASDSAIIVSAENGKGTGFYAAVEIPAAILALDPALQSLAIIGLRHWLTRDGQGVAKQAANDGKSESEALSAWAKDAGEKLVTEARTQRDRVTVGAKKVELAAARLTDALKRAGKPYTEASVLEAAPAWMQQKQSRIDQVDADLQAFLASTYTPTKRMGAKAAVESLGDLSDVD